MINKKLQKIISIGIISIMMFIPTIANAEWKQNNIGWWYTEGNSYIQNGWKLINNNWYYFDNNGYMKVGWLNDNGKWYYLSQSGSMLSNTITPDGYTLNQDGSWNVNTPTKTISDKTMATSSIDNSHSDESQASIEENNNVGNDNKTTTKKKKSSSSSSSSSSSNKSNNMWGIDNDIYTERSKYMVSIFYYTDDLRFSGVGGYSVSLPKENYKDGIDCLVIDSRDYGYKDSLDMRDTHMDEYELVNIDGKVSLVKKETNEGVQNPTTTEAQVIIQ